MPFGSACDMLFSGFYHTFILVYLVDAILSLPLHRRLFVLLKTTMLPRLLRLIPRPWVYSHALSALSLDCRLLLLVHLMRHPLIPLHSFTPRPSRSSWWWWSSLHLLSSAAAGEHCWVLPHDLSRSGVEICSIYFRVNLLLWQSKSNESISVVVTYNSHAYTTLIYYDEVQN